MSQDSFDFKTATAEWRRQMLAGGITKSADLEELESHLHEDIDNLIRSGLPDSEAFTIATQRIGQPALIRNEFKKVEHPWKCRVREFILFDIFMLLEWANTEKSEIALRFLFGVCVVSYVQFVLVGSGILNHAKLVRLRPYALVANFIFAALLTGTGVIIQALMALVLQLLFEWEVRYTRIQESHLTPTQ